MVCEAGASHEAVIDGQPRSLVARVWHCDVLGAASGWREALNRG